MRTGLFSNVFDGRRELPSAQGDASILPPDLVACIEGRAKARREEESEIAHQAASLYFEESIYLHFPEIFAGVSADDMDEVAQRREAATRRTYMRRFKRFAAWSAERGVVALPYPPSCVAMYLLLEVAHGMSKSEAKATRSAIAAVHELAGHAAPCRNSLVKRAIQYIKSLPPDGPEGTSVAKAA
jgi:hypothetical protein